MPAPRPRWKENYYIQHLRRTRFVGCRIFRFHSNVILLPRPHIVIMRKFSFGTGDDGGRQNVMPFRLGGRRFRHETEYDYLCHLQAVVRISLLRPPKCTSDIHPPPGALLLPHVPSPPPILLLIGPASLSPSDVLTPHWPHTRSKYSSGTISLNTSSCR